MNKAVSMNQQDSTRSNINMFLLGLVIASGLVLIVLSAIAADALGDLVGGFFIIGLIVVALAAVGVWLFTKWSAAKIKIDMERNRHIESMANLGFLPTGNRYNPAALEEPEDLPVSLSGEANSTISEYRQEAIELLALSALEMPLKRESTQVIPFYKARKNTYFADVGVWMNAVKFLLANQIAYEKRSRGKKIGTFLYSGTVGSALDALRRGA